MITFYKHPGVVMAGSGHSWVKLPKQMVLLFKEKQSEKKNGLNVTFSYSGLNETTGSSFLGERGKWERVPAPGM